MVSDKINSKLILILQFLFCSLVLCGQNINKTAVFQKNIEEKTNTIFDSLVKIRQDFHKNPEASGKEIRTSKKIEEHLLSLGLEVKTGIGGYGVLGVLDTGKKGKSIAWRADMDAVSIHNHDSTNNEVEDSKPHHICGHDVNMTVALGIAKVLVSQKEQLTGKVYFIFQPAEESYTGAKAMVDDGLFELINPDEIYGSHIGPMPTNIIATKPEWLFADYKTITLSFKNSKDTKAIIEYSKKSIMELQNVAPDSKFWNPNSLGDPSIGLANPNTIFKDFLFINKKSFKVTETKNEVSISAYFGASTKERINLAIPQLKDKISHSKYAKKLIDVVYSFERANLYNDKKLTEKSLEHISKTFGAENIIPLYGEMPDYRGDDFAYFQEHVPGVYFYLGGSNFEKGIVSMPHAPNFQIDETCIKTGVNYFSSLIIERLFN